MYVHEGLKLNGFKDVAIPDNRTYFARFGQLVSPSNQYTGDEPAIMPANKIDQIVDYNKYVEQEAKKASKSE